jgi:T4 superinfection immunity protein/uncharacterized protein UPF0547
MGGVVDTNTQGAFWLVVLIGLYFLPTIVAKLRHAENPNPTFIVNFFLGWTLLGWVIALAMGAGARTRDKVPSAAHELDQLASRIDNGGMTPIGDATVVTDQRVFIHADVALTERSTFYFKRGQQVPVYERRGGVLLVKGSKGAVGWILGDALSYKARTLAPTTKTCPQCAEQVQVAARICRFCRFEFTPTTADASG